MRAIFGILLLTTAPVSAQECNLWLTMLSDIRAIEQTPREASMDETGHLLVTFIGPTGWTVVRITPTNCATILREGGGEPPIWSFRQPGKPSR